MTESTTPLGCGPEGAVSDHADLLNALEDMAGSYAYAVRKPVLRDAGRTIMKLERELNTLRAEMERDEVAAEAENGSLHDALTERDAARQSLSEAMSRAEAAEKRESEWERQEQLRAEEVTRLMHRECVLVGQLEAAEATIASYSMHVMVPIDEHDKSTDYAEALARGLTEIAKYHRDQAEAWREVGDGPPLTQGEEARAIFHEAYAEKAEKILATNRRTEIVRSSEVEQAARTFVAAERARLKAAARFLETGEESDDAAHGAAVDAADAARIELDAACEDDEPRGVLAVGTTYDGPSGDLLCRIESAAANFEGLAECAHDATLTTTACAMYGRLFREAAKVVLSQGTPHDAAYGYIALLREALTRLRQASRHAPGSCGNEDCPELKADQALAATSDFEQRFPAQVRGSDGPEA